MDSINPYFSTSEFQEGLSQLNFNVRTNRDIELLISAEDWNFICMQTNDIHSADIETHNNKIVVSFIDFTTTKPRTLRVDNPYSLTVSVDQTNLVVDFDLKRECFVCDTQDIASCLHTLKVYTESSDEPVAEFKDVRAFRNDKQITKNNVDRYILNN